MIAVMSEHGVSFTLDQFNRLSRPIVSVMSDRGENICTFVGEEDRLLIRHADGYYADEWGFKYDALHYVELDAQGREINRLAMNRVVPVR